MKLSKKSYPPTTGSINKDYFRLGDYQHLGDLELETLEERLWEIVEEKALTTKPIKSYKASSNYEFYKNGWEFSVFLDPQKKLVIKIPAGIFPEVNSKEYFKNLETKYRLLIDQLSSQFLVKTTINNNEKTLTQRYHIGKDNGIIGYNTKNKELLTNLIVLTERLLELLERKSWLPDINVCRAKGGFRLQNIIVVDHNPLIYDFSSYYDVFRLYPERLDYEVKTKGDALTEFHNWLRSRVNEL